MQSRGWHALRYSEGREALVMPATTPFGVPQGVPPYRLNGHSVARSILPPPVAARGENLNSGPHFVKGGSPPITTVAPWNSLAARKEFQAAACRGDPSSRRC